MCVFADDSSVEPEISIFNLGGEKVEAQIFASAGM